MSSGHRLGVFGAVWALTMLVAAPASAQETRSYAIEFFSQASYSQEGDCPGGVNPPPRESYAKNLELLGYSRGDIEQMMADYQKGGREGTRVRQILGNRARINGEPANAFANPGAVADPKLHTVVGKFAYGFDLDGKSGANSFEDPITHEKGVDNELFRAMGCVEQFRGTYTYRPTFWDFIFGSLRETAPAWLISVTGADLSKDGPVTITFDRALEHLVFSSGGEATADVTYRVDSDPRSHHTFDGQIKAGVITITKPAYLQMLQDPLSTPTFTLLNTHLRLAIQPDGRVNGFLGGYQPWREYYFGLAQGGLSFEGNIISDIPGSYHALKRLADGNPDPKTGENTTISAAYHIEGVPVFAVRAAGSFNNVSAR